MKVGFTTTYAISAYHQWCCEFESRSGWDVQHYVIKFVSDLRRDGGFLGVLLFPTTNKTDGYDITEILLKVALNTNKQTKQTCRVQYNTYEKRVGWGGNWISNCNKIVPSWKIYNHWFRWWWMEVSFSLSINLCFRFCFKMNFLWQISSWNSVLKNKCITFGKIWVCLPVAIPHLMSQAHIFPVKIYIWYEGRRGRDHTVVGFSNTLAISC